MTKKNIIDSILGIASKFSLSDESRFDPDWLSYKVNQVRAQKIVERFAVTGQIDQTWLSDMGLINFHKVNSADNVTVNCDCEIGKTTIPQVVSLYSKEANLDLGIYSLISACGRYGYYWKPQYRWKNTPAEHTNSLFNYYHRINGELYVSNTPEKLRLIAVLVDPEDGYLINSAPITSGSIIVGVTYVVKGSGIVYAGVFYNVGDTFVGVVDVALEPVTTFAGQGTVYLYSQVEQYNDTMPYPASADMIREIELEILTKEFGIEADAIADIRNDSIDDAKKVNI